MCGLHLYFWFYFGPITFVCTVLFDLSLKLGLPLNTYYMDMSTCEKMIVEDILSPRILMKRTLSCVL